MVYLYQPCHIAAKPSSYSEMPHISINGKKTPETDFFCQDYRESKPQTHSRHYGQSIMSSDQDSTFVASCYVLIGQLQYLGNASRTS